MKKEILKREGPMYNPTFPNEIIKDLLWDKLNHSFKETANMLGVKEEYLAKIVFGRRRISHTLAKRIEKTFGMSAKLIMDLYEHFDFYREWYADQK